MCLVVLGQALVRKGMNAACTVIHSVSHFEPMLRGVDPDVKAVVVE